MRAQGQLLPWAAGAAPAGGARGPRAHTVAPAVASDGVLALALGWRHVSRGRGAKPSTSACSSSARPPFPKTTVGAHTPIGPHTSPVAAALRLYRPRGAASAQERHTRAKRAHPPAGHAAAQAAHALRRSGRIGTPATAQVPRVRRRGPGVQLARRQASALRSAAAGARPRPRRPGAAAPGCSVTACSATGERAPMASVCDSPNTGLQAATLNQRTDVIVQQQLCTCAEAYV